MGHFVVGVVEQSVVEETVVEAVVSVVTVVSCSFPVVSVAVLASPAVYTSNVVCVATANLARYAALLPICVAFAGAPVSLAPA